MTYIRLCLQIMARYMRTCVVKCGSATRMAVKAPILARLRPRLDWCSAQGEEEWPGVGLSNGTRRCSPNHEPHPRRQHQSWLHGTAPGPRCNSSESSLRLVQPDTRPSPTADADADNNARRFPFLLQALNPTPATPPREENGFDKEGGLIVVGPQLVSRCGMA